MFANQFFAYNSVSKQIKQEAFLKKKDYMIWLSLMNIIALDS